MLRRSRRFLAGVAGAPRRALEGFERKSFDFSSDEEEIVEELSELSMEELEDRSVRELEVFARNNLSESWDIQDEEVDSPMTIHNKGLNPAANYERWEINIPKAESPWSVLQVWDRYVPSKAEINPLLDNENVDSSIVEDVFHEVGHNLNNIADGRNSNYGTLEEYMYHEAIAMAAVLEAVDEPGAYYQERESELRELNEKSPVEDIDLVLEKKDDYLDVLEESLELIQDVEWSSDIYLDLNSQFSDVKKGINDLRDEKDLNSFMKEEMSVKKKLENDLFSFQDILNIGTGAHDLKPVSADSDLAYEFMIQTTPLDRRERLFSGANKHPKNKFAEIKERYNPVLRHLPILSEFDSTFDMVFELNPDELGDYVENYIRQSIQVVENLERDDLENYRQNIINSKLENLGLPGHSLGYELGRRIHEHEDYDVSEIVDMPQDEALEYLGSLMVEAQKDLDISLPLNLEIEYHTLDYNIEKQHIYEICDT